MASIAFLLFFSGGNGPTTTQTFHLPAGEIVSYDTHTVEALQDGGRYYQFFFQKNSSSPREMMGGRFAGPGIPIPLENVEIRQFADRIILIIHTTIFSQPDSYVFFHPIPYEQGQWVILYNKRDLSGLFDRIENDGQYLITSGNTYKITPSGGLETDHSSKKH